MPPLSPSSVLIDCDQVHGEPNASGRSQVSLMKSKHVHRSDVWRPTVCCAFTTLNDASNSMVRFDLLAEYRNIRVRKKCGVQGICAFPWSKSGMRAGYVSK